MDVRITISIAANATYVGLALLGHVRLAAVPGRKFDLGGPCLGPVDPSGVVEVGFTTFKAVSEVGQHGGGVAPARARR